MTADLDLARVLPEDANTAALVGRLHDPGVSGPVLVAVRGDELVDITSVGHPTMSHLLDSGRPVEVARTHPGSRRWPLADVVEATLARRSHHPHLLAPFDLQVLKAAGVTFARSMVERVIEEQAKGDPARAVELRAQLGSTIDSAVQVRPGSRESEAVKEVLVREGIWSQYLEVGIGPDPEIFTKAPVLSAVGLGAHIGVLARSTWNNPEPEVVLAVTSRGEVVGATLGNDVNLRDFEGRSALLLTEAKDNNASCAIGPFLRLFDEGFTIDDVRGTEVHLRIRGVDGFALEAVSPVAEMSRTFEELVTHAWGPHHQYPDGFALFTGTMFAPTEDRDEDGKGFTHHEGDEVTISSPRLGALTNTVTTAEDAADWTFGIGALIANLAGRALLGPATGTASDR
jgi:fumarylacetoacetate (FAA) hydrolase family protein